MNKNYLKLIRAPGLFSILGNTLASFAIFSLLNGQAQTNITQYILILVISICWYQVGMISNDIADFEEDSKERPFRPLPSGAIATKTAVNLSIIFTLVALILSFQHSLLFGSFNLLLGLSIFSYNFITKNTIIGEVNMGLIRGLNWMLVLAYFASFQLEIALFACVVWFYTSVVTHISRFETEQLKSITKNSSAALLVLLAIIPLFFSAFIELSFVMQIPMSIVLIKLAHHIWKFPR